MTCDNKHLLDVRDLSVSFTMYDTALEQKQIKVISDLSVACDRGEVIAIAGSSGSGKSLLAHAILGILPENATVSGTLTYDDKELTPRLQADLRGSKIALIPQSVAYLDPLMKVQNQVVGARGAGDKKTLARRCTDIFKRLELDERVGNLYPYQLSGGMARRVLVSTAVIGDAELIIADEPTPGMAADQALEALKVFREFADEGKGVILITHDIDLAVNFADKIAVFYAGTTLELTPSADFKAGESALRHPYSKALWRALPQNGFAPLTGFQPYAENLPTGCPFAPRCALKTPQCDEKMPEMRPLRQGFVRCFNAE